MKYFFGFAAIILLVLITFVLIWRGFTGGGDEPEAPPPLSDYAFTTTAMRLTIDGEVDAQQEHSAIRIIVSRSESRLEVLEGYDRVLTESRSYASNQEAYGVFLRALDRMGYTLGDSDPDLRDERGFCPTGRRYIYEIVDGTDVIQKFWSTSCDRDEGTFQGAGNRVLDLFREQIPDYRQLTRNVEL
jgi:hypothetical protein